MNIVRSFGIYTAAGILGRVASFILLPFFTHYLSEADYGLLNIFSNSIYFIAPFMAVGVGETFSVEYTRFSKGEMQKFISTSFFSPLLVFVCSLLGISLFNGFFEAKTGLSQHLLFLVAVLSLLNFFSDYALVIFRNENKPIAYSSFSLAKTILELALAVVLIKYLNQGAQGRINSILYTSLAGFLFVMVYLGRNGLIGFSFSKQWLKIILRRGLPAIPLFFMIFILGSADKYILNYYYGREVVGLYGFGWQFAIILNIVVGAFMTPFYPFLYKHLESLEYDKIIKVLVLYAFGLVVCIAAYLLVLPFFFKWMIAPGFRPALDFIPLMLFGQFWWGLFLVLCGLIYYKRKNHIFYYLCPAVILLTLATDYLLLIKFPVANYALVSFFSYLFCLLTGIFILRGDLKKSMPQVRQSIQSLFKKNHEKINR